MANFNQSPMTAETKNSFIKYALQKVHFYIESGFWSKLDNDSLNRWLNNFKTIDEKYCAAKLLDRFVYYSEDDILRMLDYGFNELIFKRYALQEEVKSNFSLSNSELLSLKEDFFSKSIILPLLTIDNPSESSLALTRLLTNDMGFSEKKIFHINNLSHSVLSDVKNIIIIDDFIGTGKQILDFWNYNNIKVDGVDMRLNQLKQKYPNVEIEYLCLVCTDEGITNFHAENMGTGLRITCCERLTNKFKVFSSNSIYFDKSEVDACKDVLEKICFTNDIDFLGYQGLDYAIAFHHSTPDTSLPLFFKQKQNWQPLFRNKKTVEHVNL